MAHKDLSTITQYQTDAVVECLNSVVAELRALRFLLVEHMEHTGSIRPAQKSDDEVVDG